MSAGFASSYCCCTLLRRHQQGVGGLLWYFVAILTAECQIISDTFRHNFWTLILKGWWLRLGTCGRAGYVWPPPWGLEGEALGIWPILALIFFFQFLVCWWTASFTLPLWGSRLWLLPLLRCTGLFWKFCCGDLEPIAQARTLSKLDSAGGAVSKLASFFLSCSLWFTSFDGSGIHAFYWTYSAHYAFRVCSSDV